VEAEPELDDEDHWSNLKIRRVSFISWADLFTESNVVFQVNTRVHVKYVVAPKSPKPWCSSPNKKKIQSKH
jgi:hypothetical protein